MASSFSAASKIVSLYVETSDGELLSIGRSSHPAPASGYLELANKADADHAGGSPGGCRARFRGEAGFRAEPAPPVREGSKEFRPHASPPSVVALPLGHGCLAGLRVNRKSFVSGLLIRLSGDEPVIGHADERHVGNLSSIFTQFLRLEVAFETEGDPEKEDTVPCKPDGPE